MSRLIVLSIEEGAYCHAGEVDPPVKQRRILTLREWIKKHGEDGKTYRLARWLTGPIELQTRTVVELIEHKIDEAVEPEQKEAEPVLDAGEVVW